MIRKALAGALTQAAVALHGAALSLSNPAGRPVPSAGLPRWRQVLYLVRNLPEVMEAVRAVRHDVDLLYREGGASRWDFATETLRGPTMRQTLGAVRAINRGLP